MKSKVILMLTFFIISSAVGICARPDWAPNMLLVKLAPEALRSADGSGISPADDVLSFWNQSEVIQWKPVFPTATSELGLNRWYKLTLAPGIDPTDLISTMENHAGIEAVDLNYYLYPEEIPNDPDYEQYQWYLQLLEADKAWDVSHGSSDVIIAIVDSGTDMDHEDLAGAIWHNVNDPVNGVDDDGNGYVDDYSGWDFAGDDNNPDNVDPDNMHGTHVAGISGAVGNNNIGICGSSWGCSLMICKVITDSGSGALLSDMVEGIHYAADMGARAMNISLGSSYSAQIEEEAINYAYSHNIAICAAAGNGGKDGIGDTTPEYPAAFDHAIAVGNTTRSDTKNSSSNYNNDWVDVFAPGTSIRSTMPNDEYKAETGTSMASPVVAGLAGLLISHDPSLTADEVRDRIVGGCVDIDARNPLWMGELSAGRINFYYSLAETAVMRLDHFLVHDPNGNGNNAADSGELIDLDIYLINQSWKSGSNIQLTVTVTSGNATVVNGTANYGTMASKEIRKNPENLSIQIGTARSSEITLQLHYSAAGGYSETEEMKITVDDPYPQMPNFPRPSAGSYWASPKLADLNGDGVQEIIAACNDGLLRVFNLDGSYYPGWPVLLASQQPIDSELILSAPAIGDIDHDGTMEIIVADYLYDVEYINNNPEHAKGRTIGRIHVFHSDGTVMDNFPWEVASEFVNSPASPESVGFKSSPCLADVTGDSDLEIIAGNYENKVYVIQSDGTVAPGWPKDVGTDVFATAAVGDIDQDGSQDIVIATKMDEEPFNTGKIYVFDGAGNIRNGFPVDAGNQVYSAPVLLDLNQDGNLEIVYGYGDFNEEYPNHGVNALNADGTQVPGWPYQTNSTVYDTPGIGDLNGDGQPDIVVGDYQGYVYAISTNGSALDGWPVKISTEHISSSPAIADLDNQTGPEVLIGCGDGNLYILHGDGTQMTDTPLEIGDDAFASPAVADLDQDGDIEVVMNGSSTFAFNFPGPFNSNEQYWTTFRGNNYNNGYYTAQAVSGVKLALNKTDFAANDPFVLDAYMTNAGTETAVDCDFFVILDVYGTYFFYPAWQETVTWLDLNELPVMTIKMNILDFTWPEGDFGTVTDLRFWGALLDSSGALFGNYDMITFGYH